MAQSDADINQLIRLPERDTVGTGGDGMRKGRGRPPKSQTRLAGKRRTATWGPASCLLTGPTADGVLSGNGCPNISVLLPLSRGLRGAPWASSVIVTGVWVCAATSGRTPVLCAPPEPAARTRALPRGLPVASSLHLKTLTFLKDPAWRCDTGLPVRHPPEHLACGSERQMPAHPPSRVGLLVGTHRHLTQT